jgi:DNA-binding transcriptional LysR family regulator
MLDWDDFRFILALHRKRSLKETARELGIDQATVGRRVYALEERLGTEIFEKRSDGFFLTTAGERILPTLAEIESSFLSIDRKLSGRDERIDGKVRIAMPGALANHWFIPTLGPLLARHPGLELEFLTGPEVLNLARREADLAIRLVRPKQRDLVIKRLGDLELALYAPAKRGAPLDKLPFIGLSPDSTSEAEAQLLARIGPPAQAPVIRSAAWHTVFCALKAGLGMGILPSFLGDTEPKLKRVAGVEPAKMPLWLVVHPDIQKSARVQAVMEHVSRAVRAGI